MNLSRCNTIGLLSALIVLTGSPASAQNPVPPLPGPAPSGQSGTAASPGKPSAAPVTQEEPESNPTIYKIKSVSQKNLARYVHQTVECRGIIGSYYEIKKQYDFKMDDGSKVFVVGDFPEMGGTTWILNANVMREGNQYVLSEISKVRFGTQPPPPPPPVEETDNRLFLYLGGGLILLAGIALLVMSARGKAAARQAEQERLLDEERRKADAAQREAEIARSRSQGNGPGGTVATQAGRQQAKSSTLVSVGSIEVVSGPHAGQKFPLQPGENRIGRKKDQNCSIVLDKDESVSGYHGSIVVTNDNRLVYEDRSTNGSVVDGTPVHRGQKDLPNGATIEIGTSVLNIRKTTASTSSPAAAPVAVAAPAAANPRQAQTVSMPAPSSNAPAASTSASFGAELEIVSGPDCGQKFAITRPVTTLGREDRDIILSDDSISRKHATLQVQNGSFILRDDGSTHGTQVNGQAVGDAGVSLKNTDVITFGAGKTLVKFNKVG